MRLLFLAVLMASCGGGTYHHKVEGGTTNAATLTLDERFCDGETYPTVAERRTCKDALLKALDCTEKPAKP